MEGVNLNMGGEAFHDYYTILEVSPNADQPTIRASYMRLAKLRHPDRNPDNPEATTLFQLLQNAYSVLADPNRRRAFDRQRHRNQHQTQWAGTWGNGATFRGTWGHSMRTQAQPQQQQQPQPQAQPKPQPQAQPQATQNASNTNASTPEENERSRREFRQQREEAFRRVFQSTPMRPQEDIFRINRADRDARMRESAARMKESAAKLRESAYKFKEERERRAREDADWRAEREKFVQAEINIMQLD